MQRLTTCKEITPDTDMTKEWGYSQIYKRLAEYEQAEQDGRLMMLPCGKGDIVWTFGNDNTIIEAVVDYLFTGDNGWVLSIITEYGQSFKVIEKRIGKTVFLTCAEAKAALPASQAENKGE